METNSTTDKEEFHSLFNKLLSLLNLRFGYGNICQNCCQTLENISQQLQILQADVRKLQQVVSQGFQDMHSSDVHQERHYPSQRAFKEEEDKSSSTEDEITGFSQEQTVFSPNGSFPKRFSDGKPKKRQSIDTATEIQVLGETKPKNDSSNVQNFGSSLYDKKGSKLTPLNNERNSSSNKENNSFLAEPANSEKQLFKHLAEESSKTDSKGDIAITKTESSKTRLKHKTRKTDFSYQKQRKVARGPVNSQNFGKVSRAVNDQDDDCVVSFSQTPPPKEEIRTYEMKENTEEPLEQLPKEDRIPKIVTTEYKDDNGNNLCANPVIRSREERMKIKGSACPDCQKTWSYLAQNDQVIHLLYFKKRTSDTLFRNDTKKWYKSILDIDIAILHRRLLNFGLTFRFLKQKLYHLKVL